MVACRGLERCDTVKAAGVHTDNAMRTLVGVKVGLLYQLRSSKQQRCCYHHATTELSPPTIHASLHRIAHLAVKALKLQGHANSCPFRQNDSDTEEGGHE